MVDVHDRARASHAVNAADSPTGGVGLQAFADQAFADQAFACVFDLSVTDTLASGLALAVVQMVVMRSEIALQVADQ